MRNNFRNLYADIFWWGVLAGSTIAFITIYATRLGANSFQISLLTAGPAVMNLLFSLQAGRSLEKKPIIPATFWSALASRVGYVIFILLPMWLLPKEEIWAVVIVSVLMSVPATWVSIAFNAMFADVVPAAHRAEVVGKRNALMAISMTATTLLCGQILDRVVFPQNYQIVFAIGVLGAAISTYHLALLRPLDGTPQRLGLVLGGWSWPGVQRFWDAVRPSIGLRFLTRAAGRPLLRPDLLRGPFGAFMAAYLAFYTFQYLSLPLFPIYNVHALKLTDGEISLGSALFYGLMLLFSLRLPHLSARYSHRQILLVGAFTFSLYPIILSLAQDATLYWVASVWGGAVWAILNAGLVNRLMERVPEDDRPGYMALHNLILNLGILGGSLAAPLLMEWAGLREALVLGGVMRFVAALFLLRWG